MAPTPNQVVVQTRTRAVPDLFDSSSIVATGMRFDAVSMQYQDIKHPESNEIGGSVANSSGFSPKQCSYPRDLRLNIYHECQTVNASPNGN